MDYRPKLIWLDGSAGLLAGILMLLLSGWLSDLYTLPQNLIIFNGIVNLIYGSYSTTLATRRVRPRTFILFLIFANSTWALVCFGLATCFSNTASLFGMAHLIGEGVFVGGLALFEWRWRELLMRA